MKGSERNSSLHHPSTLKSGPLPFPVPVPNSIHLKIPRILRHDTRRGQFPSPDLERGVRDSQDEDSSKVESVETDGPFPFRYSSSPHSDLIDDCENGKDSKRDDLNDESDEEDSFGGRVDARVVGRI